MSSSPAPIPCGIDAIANRYDVFDCFLAADAMQQALVSGGVHGVRLELRMPRFGGVRTFGHIYVDEGRFAGQTISTNGRHVGLEIGGSVYDNNQPTGTMRADWLDTMHTQFGTIAEAIASGIVLMTETAF